MSRRSASLSVLAALVAAGLPFAGSAIAAPASAGAAGLVATATRAMQLDTPALGLLAGSTPLRISVALPVRDKAAMTRLAVAESTPGSPSYRHFLTPSEVLARFGPSAATVSRVESWLHGEGLTAISAQPDHLLIDATGTAAVVERAFHTSLSRFSIAGHLDFANTTAAEVPAALGHDIDAVLGLQDIPLSLPHVLRAATPASETSGDLTGFYPTAVENMYDATSLPAAKSVSVAIVASGDLTGIIRNLRYAEKDQHFPKVPVSVEYTSPKSEVIYNNPNSGDAEFDLDTQISTMVAKSVKRLYIYDGATIADQDVARAINLFVSQDRALVGSASLGECDYLPWADGAMLVTDDALEEGALQGQSFFASSGDNGYACPEGASLGVPGGVPGTSWPADGTWTTGVGGTTVIANSAGTPSETIAWVGGGGGISEFEAAPNWQLPVNLPGYASQPLGQGGRGEPDIAADADANVSPVLIYTGSGYDGVGGTSVASPLSMGLWARVQNADGDKLGLASYDLYRIYEKVNPATTESTPLGTQYIPNADPKSVAGLLDVTLGTNGVYPATPGYDYTTGLGSIEAAALAKALKG